MVVVGVVGLVVAAEVDALDGTPTGNQIFPDRGRDLRSPIWSVRTASTLTVASPPVTTGAPTREAGNRAALIALLRVRRLVQSTLPVPIALAAIS